MIDQRMDKRLEIYFEILTTYKTYTTPQITTYKTYTTQQIQQVSESLKLII